MYGTACHSKKSNTVTMFGWSKEAAMCDSRMKRAASVGSFERRSRRFSATARSSAGWRASYTVAMPPWAMSRTTS